MIQRRRGFNYRVNIKTGSDNMCSARGIAGLGWLTRNTKVASYYNQVTMGFGLKVKAKKKLIHLENIMLEDEMSRAIRTQVSERLKGTSGPRLNLPNH